MIETFQVRIGRGPHDPGMPQYFKNFWEHCRQQCISNPDYIVEVANKELDLLGGRIIQSSINFQANWPPEWSLLWNSKSSHTAFVLKWS